MNFEVHKYFNLKILLGFKMYVTMMDIRRLNFAAAVLILFDI